LVYHANESTAKEKPGTSITVTARGPDAQAAIDAIEALCADKFGEGE
jgi:phosphocarrier protein